MLHDDILEEIKLNRRHGDFIYPYYGRYSIAEIESTLRTYFRIPSSRNRLPDSFLKDYKQKKVVLFVIDGLGYHHLKQWGFGNPFFDKMIVFGDIYPITSVFPSTTPAALTSIHTGFTPQEHGLPEWSAYFPEFQKIILPMLFKPAKYGAREDLLQEGGDADMIYRGTTKYTTMRENNIKPFVFLYEEHAKVILGETDTVSTYTKAVQKGAEIITYKEGYELMEKLTACISNTPGRMFAHAYWGQVDKLGHQYGPGSKEHRDSIKALSDLLYESFVKKVDPKTAADTLILLTADHGQIGITDKDIVYLNDYPVAIEMFDNNDKGEPILPTGSPNDVFLFIKPQFLAKVLSYLQQELKGVAEVMTTEEAIKRGLYGLNDPTKRYLGRVGNILIVPYPHKHVWWTESDQRMYHQKGMHGGLSEEEMIVPFGVAALSELQK